MSIAAKQGQQLIGITEVAALATNAAEVPLIAAITATWRRTRSAAQRRQSIVLPLRKAEFDGDVLALGIAGFLETLAERRHHRLVPLKRRTVEESDHGHCRLLPARRKWPHRRSTADKRDEVPSPTNHPRARKP